MIEKLILFWQKWLAFFRPVPGWRDRLRKFKGGQTVWDVPGKPGKSKVVPFPLEWIPHRLEVTEEDDEATKERGFAMIPVTCIEGGEEAAVGVGVLCLRCGVPLHPRHANMVGGFDPPYCKRCKWPIKLT